MKNTPDLHLFTIFGQKEKEGEHEEEGAVASW